MRPRPIALLRYLDDKHLVSRLCYGKRTRSWTPYRFARGYASGGTKIVPASFQDSPEPHTVQTGCPAYLYTGQGNSSLRSETICVELHLTAS